MKAYQLSTSLEEVRNKSNLVARAHRDLQDLEAGVSFTPEKQATALFSFLDAMGFYPERVRNADSGKYLSVEGTYLVDMGNGYGVRFSGTYENGSEGISPAVSVLGPDFEYSDVWLDSNMLLEIIERAFPDGVITNSVMIGKDHSALHHVSIRPAFMQEEGDLPLASGSAVSEDLSLALMQATIRMMASILSDECACIALEKLDDARIEQDFQKAEIKTLSELYGDYETELEKRISEVLNKKFGIK